MSNGVKVIIYALLVIATAITGYFFFHNFGKLFETEKPAVEAAASAEPSGSATNAPAADTNTTNAAEVAVVTNGPVATNIITGQPLTNTAADTNVVAETTPPPTKAAAPPTVKPQQKQKSRIGLWTGLFLACIIALGGVIAWDISNYMGNKSLRILYNDDHEGMKDPEYDQAEQVWADGKPLDAIRMMRDYLNKHPREVHVSLRIAEIYEKDLNNHLAAALEYEEVLKKKLPDERWGWAAIHLCNLYFKLGHEAKAYPLLQRIVKEYGETQAAEKARKRLNEVDPSLLAESQAPEVAEEPAPKTLAADEPKSNLPPGFRPKK